MVVRDYMNLLKVGFAEKNWHADEQSAWKTAIFVYIFVYSVVDTVVYTVVDTVDTVDMV